MANNVMSISPALQCQVGESLGTDILHLSLQRLIMVAGANRDFALSHSDNATAQWGNAPAAYADVIFVFTMFERLLMQWAGPSARVRKLGPLKLHDFLVCGQDVIGSGVVTAAGECTGPDGATWREITAEIKLAQNDGRVPVSGLATIMVPLS